MVTSPTVNVTTYYAARVACANGGTTTVPATTVFMVPTTTSMVPYYESFETLNQQIKLPNCSWAVSNTVTALTQTVSNANGRIPRTGTNFGMFVNSPPGANYFYSNGLQLTAGITYSASVWWLTEGVGYTNWTDLSILIGPNQTPAGQTTVASTGSPAVSPIHKLLTGNFTVPTTGIYYLAIRGTASAGNATYLSFDDIRVGIPCSLNSPSVTLSTLSSTVCSDKPIAIFATGADTYTWNTGDNSAAITVTPGLTTTGYTVSATKLLSGCTATFAQNLTVKPSPVLFATSNKDEVCAGSEVNLTAYGTNVSHYYWSNNVNTQDNTVYPTSSEVYTVIAVGLNGCSSVATKSITVNALPSVNIGANPAQICTGEQVTLTGNIAGGGAATYNWLSNTSIVYLGNPLTIMPTSSAIFTLTATNSKGCSNKAQYVLAVQECTGLNKVSNDNSLKVYPNPSAGVFEVEFNNGLSKTIEIVDLTGRVVYTATSSDEKVDVNIRNMANGVYYLKLQSGKTTEIVKIVKVNN